MLQTQIIYCGDNLHKLQELPDRCVDLIYIDPPFNSNRNYEVFWGDAKEKRAFEDRFGAVHDYIHWMRPRVLELYRVLKPNGSFYYHCDTHADAYVKVMLDQIFGLPAYQNAIIWKRSSAHSDARRWGAIHDTIFFYAKGRENTWNRVLVPPSPDYIAGFFDSVEPETGRRYARGDLTASGLSGGGYEYEFKGIRRVWRYPKERLEELDAQGRLHWPQKGVPRLKRYHDEFEGVPAQDVWTDIRPLHNLSAERLGYPTQKPSALLERILRASSNPGDVVLDAFCGCGTTLSAAEGLGRRWIGIDMSPTACRVMGERLSREHRLVEGKDFWLRDLPKTEQQLRQYPPFEFENWAVNALNTVLVNGTAIANRAKVNDKGIDGRIYPVSVNKVKQAGQNLFGDTDNWLPVQVKQKDKVGRPDIDSFETAMRRQQREKGFFVSFDYTQDALKEINRALRQEAIEIIPLTVNQILEEQVVLRV